MSAWTRDEGFNSTDEYAYRSPVLTYDGMVVVAVCLPDAEGAAIRLRIAETPEWHGIDLTAEEARELGDWLAQAAHDVEQEQASA